MSGTLHNRQTLGTTDAHEERRAQGSWVRRVLAAATSVALAVAGVVVGAVPAAHAATVFSDNFSSGIGGWTNQHWAADSGSALSVGNVVGNWSSLLRAIDLSSYQNVELSYSYFISGNVDQSLQVSVRPTTGSGYTVVADHATNTGGWQNGTVDIGPHADLRSGFALQFAVTGRPGGGGAPVGFEMRIDNVVIEGDIDTTPPSAALISPPNASMVPNSGTTDFRVSATDDHSGSSEIQIRYRFAEAADPANFFLAPSIGWANPTAGEYSQPRTGSSIRSSMPSAIPSGSAVNWYAQLRDHSGNETELLIATVYAGEFPVVITSPAPPDGAVSVPYSYQITATGSTPISYSLASGSDPLPPGLTLSSGGLISGTPTVADTYTFTIETWNGLLPQVTATYTIEIAAAPTPPTITSGNPPGGQETIAYSHTFTASGTGSIAFSHDSGTLPPGLALVGDQLTGTPTTFGDYTFEIRAASGTAPDAVVEYTVAIALAPVPPTITTASLPAATFGQAYSHTVLASGDAPLTFSSGDLAALGLGISASGVISGTPTAAGSFAVNIEASNTAGTDDETFTLVIDDEITVTSAAPADGMETVAYSHTFVANAAGAVSFSLQSGTLPNGLSLVGDTLSGTPTADGSFSFTIRAANGAAPDVDTPYTVVIAAAPVAPVITSGAPTAGVFDQLYTFTVTAMGDPTLTYSAPGLVALGLSINFSTGAITGIPTVAGSHPVTITVSNGVNPDAVETYTFTFAENIIVTSPAPADGDVGVAYTHTFTGTASGPITFSQPAGTLPPGLSLTGATLSGTPAADGSFTFTIRASTGTSPSVDTVYTVGIDPAPPIITVTSLAPPAGVIGTAYSHIITLDSAAAPNFVVTSGSLPAGLSLNALTGEIEGTPTADGTATFSITITDSGRQPLIVAYSITIAPASTGGGGAQLADTGGIVDLGHVQSALGFTLLGLVLLALAQWRLRTRRQ